MENKKQTKKQHKDQKSSIQNISNEGKTTNLSIVESFNNGPVGRDINPIGQHTDLAHNNEIIERSLRFDDPKTILNISTGENFQDDPLTTQISSRDPLLK